jgi:hypothetical protein
MCKIYYEAGRKVCTMKNETLFEYLTNLRMENKGRGRIDKSSETARIRRKQEWQWSRAIKMV